MYTHHAVYIVSIEFTKFPNAITQAKNKKKKKFLSLLFSTNTRAISFHRKMRSHYTFTKQQLRVYTMPGPSSLRNLIVASQTAHLPVK